jgi:hypothetical protein
MRKGRCGGGEDDIVGQAWWPCHLLKPSLLKYSRTSVLSSTFCMRREVAAEGAEERWMAAARLPARSEGIPVGAKHSAAPAMARRTVPRMSIFKNKTRIAFDVALYVKSAFFLSLWRENRHHLHRNRKNMVGGGADCHGSWT